MSWYHFCASTRQSFKGSADWIPSLSCSDSILRHASSDFKKMGQRIFVFIVGGATRSEVLLSDLTLPIRCYGFKKRTNLPFPFLAYIWFPWWHVNVLTLLVIYVNLKVIFLCMFQLRACHKLSTKLKREVVLGSSSIDDPPQFITVWHFICFLPYLLFFFSHLGCHYRWGNICEL